MWRPFVEASLKPFWVASIAQPPTRPAYGEWCALAASDAARWARAVFRSRLSSQSWAESRPLSSRWLPSTPSNGS
ncbi:hypothetical protein NHG22_25625 [Streptomyces sp. ATE26]|uniref:hypothetical protein n=1 Tax=unclassified Streptomyces TaxID=2593676 RepID=UPI00117DB3E8|nr:MULTISPECIES: hypothetical protein [unclassified Streptomyces]MDI1457160.1 hypothetical protein [Streptomyces sp. ATE26]